MKIPESPQDLSDIFEKERAEISELREKISNELSQHSIATIRERRIFLQNIALASATLVSLASVFSSFSKSIYFPYLIFGLVSHLAVICIVFLHIRTTLDREQERFTTQKDKYSRLLNEHISLCKKYTLLALSTKTKEEGLSLAQKFDSEKAILPSMSELKKGNEKILQDMELRRSGKANMEFYGEFINFFFVLGSLFVVLAIYGRELDLVITALISLGIFIITFTDVLDWIFLSFFKILTPLHKYFQGHSN